MTAENDLKSYLEALAERHPTSVIGRLDRGSKVQKSLGLSYEIDDPDIDRKLGDFPEGAVPHGLIHKVLRTSQGEILAMFKGLFEVPFSRAYEAGLGECLEKAILVQLSAQRARDAFLINGYFAEDDDIVIGSHAYNIVFKDGKPFLLDAQNPLAKDSTGKITHPYIAPIIGIDKEYAFMVPQEWRQGRTYSIF